MFPTSLLRSPNVPYSFWSVLNATQKIGIGNKLCHRFYLLRAVTVHQWWDNGDLRDDILVIESRSSAPVMLATMTKNL